MFIYLIVNRATGKYYVGQHKGGSLQRYLTSKLWDAEHQRNGRSYLYASMRKYGRSAFTIHALLADVQTKAELDAYERDFISFLRSQDPEYGYNICKGGEGFTGPHSPEARKKNSEASIKMWRQPGHRETVSTKISVAQKKNSGQISAALMGNKHALGMTHTDEWKENARFRLLEKPISTSTEEATRRKIRFSLLGNQNSLERKLTLATREKISASMKARG